MAASLLTDMRAPSLFGDEGQPLKTLLLPAVSDAAAPMLACFAWLALLIIP